MNSLRILEGLNSFELIKLIRMEIARLHCAHGLALSLAHLSGPACYGPKGQHEPMECSTNGSAGGGLAGSGMPTVRMVGKAV
jgi:hypothetical protein